MQDRCGTGVRGRYSEDCAVEALGENPVSWNGEGVFERGVRGFTSKQGGEIISFFLANRFDISKLRSPRPAKSPSGPPFPLAAIDRFSKPIMSFF